MPASLVALIRTDPFTDVSLATRERATFPVAPVVRRTQGTWLMPAVMIDPKTINAAGTPMPEFADEQACQ